MLLEASVSEAEVHRVRPGQTAAVRIEAFPDLRLTGKVTRVGTLARASADRPLDDKRFDLIVELDATTAELRPEMTARADILVGTRSDVLARAGQRDLRATGQVRRSCREPVRRRDAAGRARRNQRCRRRSRVGAARRRSGDAHRSRQERAEAVTRRLRFRGRSGRAAAGARSVAPSRAEGQGALWEFSADRGRGARPLQAAHVAERARRRARRRGRDRDDVGQRRRPARGADAGRSARPRQPRRAQPMDPAHSAARHAA